MTTGGTIVATYTYDALNQRIGIKDNGTQTWTVYDGKSPMRTLRRLQRLGQLDDAVSVRPGVVNGAVGDRDPGSDQLQWDDGLVSDRQAGLGAGYRRATSGTELDHIVYDSFGNIVTETNATNGDRFKFAGMEYDATTGQYYDLLGGTGRNRDASTPRIRRGSRQGTSISFDTSAIHLRTGLIRRVRRSRMEARALSHRLRSRPRSLRPRPQTASRAGRRVR